MKKIIALILAATVAVLAFTSCGKSDKTDTDTSKPDSSQTSGTDTSNDSLFDSAEEIGVISREDGSGTRGAFIELFGIEQKDEEGNKVDKTIATASVTNNTSVMMTTVSGDLYAIGYISLGSLNNTVKAVKIDGAEATVENIKNGSYKVSRPFNVATKGELS
ncbi:MAG: phosphate ABC transporter substrate-binding protein, partial [Firmicutes bacterium]|nr:phosphate ABC transporter substrate-binding protein [Bacillota bacterium]